ncbi:MAG: hypothetical protein RLZZ543_43 [Bacteroidota bacterium]|jgi:hypothetical protein
MSGNDNYNIEDFWPGAEELLDQHFKKKPGFGTKGMIATALLILGAAIGGWMLYSDASNAAPVAITHELNSPSSTAESAPSARPENESNSTLTSESSASVSSNETHASTSIAEKTSAASTATPSNETSASNRAANSASSAHKKTAVTSSAAEIPSHKSSATSTAYIRPSKSNVEVNSNQSTAGVTNTTTANGNVNSAKAQSDRVATTDGSASTSASNATNVEVTPSSEITARNTKESAALNSTVNPSATQTENTVGNTFIHPSKSKATTALSTEGIASLMRLPLGTLETPLSLASIANDPAQSELLKSFPMRKKPFAISYQLGAGVFAISKQLSANNADAYVARRLAEEQNSIGTSFQAGLRIQHNRWALNSGVEFNQYGEKIQYDNWLFGTTNVVNPVTTYQLDSMVNVRYFYVQGNEFIQTTITQFTDTIVTFDTTQVFGQVASDVSKVNSRTQISYVEIPLAIDYDIIQKKHFSFALRTGVSMGILSQRRGYYLDRQLAEFTDISASKEFRSIVWNARVGVEAQYFFRPAFSVFIRPEFRTNLQSVFNTNTGINQRYTAWGVSFGLSKSF